MISRKEAAENILSYIRENNFEPQNIKYLNDYSVFDLGQDGIVHFEIKEISGWIFGMWIQTDDEKLKNNYNYPAIQFFCKHKKI